MRYFLICLAIASCSGETTAPVSTHATTSPGAGAAPIIIQPICATWQIARALRELPQIASWYTAPCPAGMYVELCNGSEASDDEPLPDNAVWFDGQPNGMSPGCMPDEDTAPFTCATDADCPSSGAECWDPFCNTQLHQCMQTYAFKLGTSCAAGAGVCNVDGELRSDVTGLKISQAGWPAVCDAPQFPE